MKMTINAKHGLAPFHESYTDLINSSMELGCPSLSFAHRVMWQSSCEILNLWGKRDEWGNQCMMPKLFCLTINCIVVSWKRIQRICVSERNSMSAAPRLMYSHLHVLHTTPACPASPAAAWTMPRNSQAMPIPSWSPSAEKENAMSIMVQFFSPTPPPNAMTVWSNDLCVVSP